MMDEKLHPPKAAARLLNILDTFCQIQALEKFPINIDMLAYETANIFKWSDPINDIKEVNIGSFEGALLRKDSGKWAILYNSSIESAGRILFTKAHELGHYILHKNLQNKFQCGIEEFKSHNDNSIEIEANKFASYLLMPINDFRQQIDVSDLFQSLSLCALRYGVSLTAAILKWLEFTDESAILINSRDGFILWAVASQSARKNGAYFKTKTSIIEIPNSSLAGNNSIINEILGKKVNANIWFEYANKEAYLTEYKVSSEKYDNVLTLLVLPRSLEVYSPRFED